MYFRYFVIIYPWKRVGPSFIWRNLRVLITQECFVPSLVEIGLVILEKKIKIWKVYNNADNDNDQIVIKKLTWAFGSVELKR